MYFDGFGLHVGIGAYDRLETLTGQDPVASDLYRGDCDDIVGAHIEACPQARPPPRFPPPPARR
jgi:hypothetical protein